MKNSLFVILFLCILFISIASDIRFLNRQKRETSVVVSLSISALTLLLFGLWMAGVKVGMPTRPFIDPIGLTLYEWIKEMLA
ncbi:hypothetical protein [Gorillibacterium sp. CAU 1737]|uniref:hypothetical protein n=1 Tax=Gorillibacterium sp. CAU 1737 TaxID=3140362 RepID=UPI003260D402